MISIFDITFPHNFEMKQDSFSAGAKSAPCIFQEDTQLSHHAAMPRVGRGQAAGAVIMCGAALAVLTFVADFRHPGFGDGLPPGPATLQQEVGAVGPGSLLTLQTAGGPMQLTVDSQMNQGKLKVTLAVCSARH